MIDVKEPLIPKIGVVTDIRIDTPDVKTFRVVTPNGKKAFEHKPGQYALNSRRRRSDVFNNLLTDK